MWVPGHMKINGNEEADQAATNKLLYFFNDLSITAERAK